LLIYPSKRIRCPNKETFFSFGQKIHKLNWKNLPLNTPNNQSCLKIYYRKTAVISCKNGIININPKEEYF